MTEQNITKIKCPNHGDKYIKITTTIKFIFYKCTKCSCLIRIENNGEGKVQ